MAKRGRRIVDEDDEEEYHDATSSQTGKGDEEPQATTQEDEQYEVEATRSKVSVDDYVFSQLSTRDREVVVSYGITLCKAAMAAELKNQVITKGYISKYVVGEERGLKLDHIYRCAQQSLHKLGFELVTLPTKDQKEGDNIKLGRSLNASYVVKSTLPNKFQEIIGDYFLKSANDNWEIANPFGSIVLIICCIALHKNNISKKELELITGKFGISSRDLEELLKKAIKEEYVLEERISNGERNKNVKRRRKRGEDQDDDFVQYHIGRRTRVEFGKDKVLQFLQEMYGGAHFDLDRAAVSLSWW